MVLLSGIMHMKVALLLLALSCTYSTSAGLQYSKAGCESSCGNLTIPYPFGTREGCYRDSSFLITCNSTTPYLTRGNIQVLNISLDTSELLISARVSRDCYSQGRRTNTSSFIALQLGITNYAISNTKNKFTVVGCDTYAYVNDKTGKKFKTGCMSICNTTDLITNDSSCSGVGCCQTSFPKAIKNYNISIGSYRSHTYVQDFNPCSYAFLVQDGFFNFSYQQDLFNLRNLTEFPVVLNWAADNTTCAEAQKNTTSYACKENAECQDSESGIGYLCQCKPGYQGNPYLSHPDTPCTDIDECSTINNCSMRCHNFDGYYTCSCPSGYKGDGYIHGSGCKSPVLEISLGISVGLLIVLTLITSLCLALKQRALKQLRRRNFKQNGGIMLQGYGDRTKIFTETDLKNATNNFEESKILGRGGQGTVYKGIMPDNTAVAIKKSRVGGDPRQIKDFINEVAVLSQINHRNVVKLLGCCLETEVPLLVYEFVDNGTLLDHIDPSKNECPIPWETRLRIAAETAEAISYLHSSVSIPIVHRDIKSTNILLDHNHSAKVSDFGASRLVPLDEAQVSTVVQGTLGYLDPEYLHTGQLNEKSDVYSFGVVLVELITGNKAVEFNRTEQRNLAMYFVSSMKEDRLWEILDRRVVDKKKNGEQLKEVALLARRCLRVNGEERPTMKEVAKELEGLIAMQEHPWVNGKDLMSEESEYLLGHVHAFDGYEATSAGTSIAYDTIQKQIEFENEDGR